MAKIINACHLSDAVHAELRAPDIDGPDTTMGAQDGTDGRPAGTIIANQEFL